MVNERPRILIVDDDEGTRTTLARILQKKGYETEMAATGQEALEKARESAFNLAFLDIRLPDMEGVDLIAPLKEMQPAVAVIMITGYASVGTAVQALDEGASAYMIKPLDMEGLLATIREALEKQRLIREKRRAESQRDAMLEELRQSEERFRQFFENIPEYSYLISPEGAILDVNRAACQVLGYPKEELMGKPLKSIYAPESLPKMGQLLNGWRETGQLFDEEMVILTRAGDRRTVLLSAEAVRDREGQVLHSISVQKDITERKQAEEALRWERDRAMALEEAAAIVNSTLDLDRVLDRILEQVSRVVPNDAASIMLVDGGEARVVRWRGYKQFGAEEVVSTTVVPVAEVPTLQKMTETGEPSVASDTRSDPHWDRWPTMDWLRSAANAPIILRDEVVGFLNVDSATPGFHTQSHADTLRAFASQAATAIDNAHLFEETVQLKAFHESIVQNMGEGILVQNEDGVITFCNPAAAEMLGYAPDELAGLHGTALIPVDQQTIIQAAEERRGRGETDRYELELVRKDGRRFPALVSASPRSENGHFAGSVAVFRDIAERVQAEKERQRLLVEIRQQAQRMQEIMDTVPEGVLLLDCSGHVVTANRVAKGDLATLADAKVGDLLTHLGGRPIAELLTSPPIEGMWHEVAADGWVFEVIARPVEDGPEPTGWVLVMRDVTRERDVQRQAQQQERLAAVGQLAAGIAHDFNNIMGIIVLYSQLSRRASDLPPDVRDRLETIDRQAKHATELIGQVLDFSRRSVLKRGPLDLEALVKEQFKLLQRTLPENIQVVLAYGVEEYSVQADLTRMQQIIMNLALNARDAMLPTGGGELRIALSRLAEADETECSTCGEVVAGPDGWLMLEVADTGTGIPEETLPHIFDPFYTTKERGRGTGLGLAQVYGIVKQHEGHIVVATRPGEGTTFAVYLPALSVPEPSAPPDRAPQELPEGRGETILVVEDNPDLRRALVTSVAGLGYRTLEAPDGQEALALFAEQADDPSAGLEQEIALVLSDLVMPRMGGQALFHALRQRDPAVKVVLLTGHPMEEELEELAEQGLSGWMLKPTNLEKLAQLLQRVLRDG